MRISTLQTFDSGVRGINDAQSAAFKTQQQMATGKRVLTPSDDPVASSRIIQLDQEKAQLQQYMKNISGAERRLTQEETQLDAVVNLITRVQELTVQAGGTVTHEGRVAIAKEIDERITELYNIGNTRDANGEYLFSGFQGSEAAFARNPDGRIVYQGDDGQREVPVSNSALVPTSDSGKRLFVAIPTAESTFTSSNGATNTGGASISLGHVVDQAAYDTQVAVPGGDYAITFNGGTNEFEVVDQGGNPVVNVPLNTNGTTEIVVNGSGGEPMLRFSVTGIPNNGDTFALTHTEKESMFDTLGRLTDGLRQFTDSADASKIVASALGNLDQGLEQINQVLAEVGARFNTLESLNNSHDATELVNDQILSEIRDLDYAEAASRLTAETFTLQAAQQSFSKISSLSLFNFLR